MAITTVDLPQEILDRKQASGLSYKALMILGLDALQNTKQHNSRPENCSCLHPCLLYGTLALLPTLPREIQRAHLFASPPFCVYVIRENCGNLPVAYSEMFYCQKASILLFNSFIASRNGVYTNSLKTCRSATSASISTSQGDEDVDMLRLFITFWGVDGTRYTMVCGAPCSPRVRRHSARICAFRSKSSVLCGPDEVMERVRECGLYRTAVGARGTPSSAVATAQNAVMTIPCGGRSRCLYFSKSAPIRTGP